MEEQEIGKEDVGVLDVTGVTKEEQGRGETKLELVQRMRKHVANTKAWALAKVESRVKAIEDAGGEVPAALADEIGELRKECS